MTRINEPMVCLQVNITLQVAADTSEKRFLIFPNGGIASWGQVSRAKWRQVDYGPDVVDVNLVL